MPKGASTLSGEKGRRQRRDCVRRGPGGGSSDQEVKLGRCERRVPVSSMSAWDLVSRSLGLVVLHEKNIIILSQTQVKGAWKTFRLDL